eukprot:TRINITY_DN1847_c0_g1_i1.p1 TRINITY_DN1847_c0_g1~~TRINITY_DN1847_c0_g1_i1.p1  ORF type:complete len:1147 (+),score=220.61 TRINITY_DN1847_c0_g1_i1:169-3609(+)
MNVFGAPIAVRQMQSEAGVAGALHGALRAGSLCTSFTSSQGLMLMIPTMYKIAGENLPMVLHVASRSVAGQGVTIYSDHSDINAVRNTGFALLSSHSVQEAADLAVVAHVASLKTRVPFLHFFEGMQLSHELTTVHELLPDTLSRDLVPWDAVRAFRAQAGTPARPRMFGTVQGRETYWQQQEATVPFTLAVPAAVDDVMAQMSAATGRRYRPMDYEGAPDAERVVVVMGAAAETVTEAVRGLVARGEKVGVVKVHLYRPWSASHFLAALPRTAQRVAVLDRAGHDTAAGSPLHLDVLASLWDAGRGGSMRVSGGRYGVGDKAFSPAHVRTVFAALTRAEPPARFTVGIDDDVMHLSLPLPPAAHENDEQVRQAEEQDVSSKKCVFWGIGGDGTVSANRNAVCILSEHTPLYAQGVFVYDAHKAGGVTVSHLRFASRPITSHYPITVGADFVSCGVASYFSKFDVAGCIKRGGTLLVNTSWGADELSRRLPADTRRLIAERGVRLFALDADAIAAELGLGAHTNNLMQAAFFKLSGVLPVAEALPLLKKAIASSYASKFAGDLLERNLRAVDAAIDRVKEIHYDRDAWLTAKAESQCPAPIGEPREVRDIMRPILRLEADRLPVSAFLPYVGGWQPLGLATYEKRGISRRVARWDPTRCIECGRCSAACPHSALRAARVSPDQARLAPSGFESRPAKAGPEGCRFTIQVSERDCTGCNACAAACPTGCLSLVPAASTSTDPAVAAAADRRWAYSLGLSSAETRVPSSIREAQYVQPRLEFAGACAGCAQVPYVKLLTQLFGRRLVVANGVGCSVVWGGTAWFSPYTADGAGRGPAWSSSLFENAAEFGYGMAVGLRERREALRRQARRVLSERPLSVGDDTARLLRRWLDGEDDGSGNLAGAIEGLLSRDAAHSSSAAVIRDASTGLIDAPTTWVVGGDGWAHDIDFGGLDHVLASGEKINLLVLDNEQYANTGGQASKATPYGATAKLASAGLRRHKKDLAQYAISTYPDVYVAQVCYGADMNHTLRSLREAERHPGTSLVLCYCPCIEHDIRGCALNTSFQQMRDAVTSGYWPLLNRDPRKGAASTPADATTKEKLRQFASREGRFSRLVSEAHKAEFEEFARGVATRKERLAKGGYLATSGGS